MKKQKNTKSKKKGSFGRVLLYVIAPVVGSIFVFLILNTENRYLYKEVTLMEEELGALQNGLESRLAEVQKLESEDRIVALASERLGMIRIDIPIEQLFISQEKINRIKRIVNSKYE